MSEPTVPTDNDLRERMDKALAAAIQRDQLAARDKRIVAIPTPTYPIGSALVDEIAFRRLDAMRRRNLKTPLDNAARLEHSGPTKADFMLPQDQMKRLELQILGMRDQSDKFRVAGLALTTMDRFQCLNLLHALHRRLEELEDKEAAK